MRAILRQFRRAPGRIAVSIFALALAIGAVGVLAIPGISEGSLHDAARRDGLADIVVETSEVTPLTIARLGALDGVAAAEGQVASVVDRGDSETLQIVGLGAGREMDIVQIERGRAAEAVGEVVLDPDAAALGALGDRIALAGEPLTVVGYGSTIWWSGTDVAYTDTATAQAITGVDGLNRVVVTATDDGADTLRDIAGRMRTELAGDGATFTEAPVYLPDGSTPIDDDIRQVSTMIGLLGIVAGLVALVLLASTTNTLITERTREVAIMRALGAKRRPLRRRLRRIAVGIAAAALVLGLPLGLFIANLIARMVLEKFVGVTPAIGWDPAVLAGSALYALFGARLVAARAARRVTRQPLVNALRDREGTPFGQRLGERLAGRLPLGGLATRMATRSSVHRRARATGMVLQLAVGVGALVTCAGLVSSVNGYNAKAFEPWMWASTTTAANPGLPIDQGAVAGETGAEAGIDVYAETGDWEIEVYGLQPRTEMFATTVVDGRWLGTRAGTDREAMVSDGFARQVGIDVGDTVDLELASGTAKFSVVGLVDDGWPSVYVDRDTLAADLGTPGGANVVWSARDFLATDLGVPTDTETEAEVAAADKAGRDAIVAIFGALGAIVVGVALLSVTSTTAVNLYERRHELAALQAIGARRRALRGLVLRELGPLAIVGAGLGVLGGWFGTVGIIGSFEASEAVAIGTRFPVTALPLIIGASAVGVVLLARLAVRSIGRRSIVTALRSAA